MRWVEHVECMGKEMVHIWSWSDILRKRDHFEDPGIHVRIILKWIFRKLNGVYGLHQSDSGQGQMTGLLMFLSCSQFL
jgi:hypothetical protein